MKIKLSTNDLEEIILENQTSRYQNISPEVKEHNVCVEHSLGKAYYNEIYFKGVHIAFGDIQFRENALIQFESDFETVEMHFDLLGATHSEISPALNYSFTQHTHNIIYVPGVKGKFHTSPSTRVMEINMHPSVFSKHIEEDNIYYTFLQNIKLQNPVLMARHNMPITPDMLNTISAIMECNRTGIYKRLFLEAKVIELLMLQLEQFATHDCRVFCSLKATDIEKMHYAREIILKRLDNPCSLIDLARQIGTNEFALKKGFKEVFGTTVFGMVSDIRLQQAKDQLLNGNKNIAEISFDTGYKNPTHFSAAFKRKFGVSPSTYLSQSGY